MLLLAVCCGTWAEGKFVKISSTSDLTDGNYLIVYEASTQTYVFNGALETLDAVSNFVNVVYKSQNDEISGSDFENSYVTITNTGTAYTIKSKSGYYIGHTGSKNTLNTSTTDAYENTITFNNTGNAVISCGNYSLKFNSTNGQMRFRYFTSGQQSIFLYKYEETGGDTPSLTANNLALTGNTNLSFDLYNNASAQTISYTTSSTGAVTVSGGDGYVTTSVDETNKTITVTPIAVTPSAQTITVSQAADDTYAAGSTTFTVSITDSTPFTGGDVTFVAGTDKGSTTGNNSADQMTKSGVTVSSDDAAFATAEYRLYASSTTTISTASGNITKIVFTKNGSYNLSNLSTQTGSYDSNTGTWTGNAESVSFYASAQVRLDQISVTVNTSGKQPAGLAYETTEYTVNLGETFSTPTLTNPNNLSITYASSNESVATVNEETGAVTTLAAGTTTITASSEETEQYLAGSATYTLTVVDPNAPGTENNPYTVAQALGATPADNIYVQGIISTITEVSTEFGNATYRISDGGTTANEMIIYRGKYLNNVAFTSTDQIAVGDVVKVYGKLSNYQGTNQMAQGNYIVTLQGSKPSPEMSFPEESYSATLGETFTAPALTITPNTLTVTYSSSDTSVATVNETSGEVNLLAAGETTITATFAGNDDYRSATASYDLTVTDPNAPDGTIDNPYRVQDVIDGTATGNDVYVKGYIVGEYVGKTTAPHTSGFTTDGNIAIADEFTTAPTASGSIPVQLTNDLKSAWGNLTNNGEFITYEVLLKGNVDTYFTVNGIKGTSEVTATGLYVKIASSGKSSYCASDAIELVDGVNAYIVTNVTSTSATMTQLTGAVPANEGIMLVGTGGAEYTLPIATEAASVSGNLLIGTASGENVQEEAGKTYLALKNGEFVVMNPGTVKPHKAYLSVDSSVIGNNSKLAITYEENNATAINEVQTTKEDGVFYNLNGMRVSAPQKGIYILNGKKIIVK